MTLLSAPLKRNRLAPVLALLLGFAPAPAHTAPTYIVNGRVDGVELLPAPPAPGSAEQAADLASVRLVFKSRTPAQEAAALQSAKLSMFLFTPAIGEWFQPGRCPKTEALFNAVKTQIGNSVDSSKEFWNRKRPYQVDPELTIGQPEKNASYPSGHSTRGTVYSLLFAELMPEKREAILQIGRQIGWDRIIIGKHFPTDVYAGRFLGKAIFRELNSNADFRKACKEAREELQAAMAGGPKAEHASAATSSP